MAFVSAYRRENPKQPKPPKPAAGLYRSGAGADHRPPRLLVEQPAGDAPLAMAAVEPAAVATEPDPVAEGTLEEPARRCRAGAFIDRLAAFVLDFILIVIVVQALDLDRDFDGPLGRLGLLLAVAYHVGFWTWKRRRSAASSASCAWCASTASRCSSRDALVRGLTGIFSLAVVGLGFLWILPRSRAAGVARPRRRHVRRQGAAQTIP